MSAFGADDAKKAKPGVRARKIRKIKSCPVCDDDELDKVDQVSIYKHHMCVWCRADAQRTNGTVTANSNSVVAAANVTTAVSIVNSSTCQT